MKNHLKLFEKANIKKNIITGLEHNNVEIEFCYHLILEENKDDFWKKYSTKLTQLLSSNSFESTISLESNFRGNVIEIGPRTNVKTATCTNILNVFETSGIEGVKRIEKSTRYQIDGAPVESFFDIVADRMTEMIYDDEIDFEKVIDREKVFTVDILADKKNLVEANKSFGLAFDQSDIEFYYDLFVNKLKRNPTDVELFDLAQSDSEHSRHWFFRGNFLIDGELVQKSLMDDIKSTLDYSNKNSLIAFCDNSSAIQGFDSVKRLRPSKCDGPSSFQVYDKEPLHIIYSAETHNFPTAVCPFQGATTGTGGRIRDIHSTGRGSYEIAGVAGYSFGNLRIPGNIMPWENVNEPLSETLASPLKIAIDASNGASDYGNKFGEPVICGFSRSFGQRMTTSGERYEYLKPIMFSGGIGAIDDEEVRKVEACDGMKVAKIGGPVYRIGCGGGAASSTDVQGDRCGSLDYAAVQRGDAEMAAKLRRVVRACAERIEGNPILSIHDQGAGGNGNVIKEIIEGCGCTIESSRFEYGDESVSMRELWTAEYQENDAALIDPSKTDVINSIGKREKCTVSIIGETTKDHKRVILIDSELKETAVDIDVGLMEKRGRKTFELKRTNQLLTALVLPEGLKFREALTRVLNLPAVASKKYLTCKVDRSVTGLIAQQQCVGPLHTPLADVGVVALSYFETVGAALAVGEQPIKMHICPAKGARMTLAETLTNLMMAPITDIKDIKMSGNWMWAAKCDGEGVRLVEAVRSLCDALRTVGCAIDGGKDSLSMAVKVDQEVVKAPGTLVLTAYAACTDINNVITPAIDATCMESCLIYVRLSDKYRLAGSALAQCYSQIGESSDCPDVDNLTLLNKLFNIVQRNIKTGNIIAGHDVSDGGLIVCLLEMAFAGNCSIEAKLNSKHEPVRLFFAEETAIVLQVRDAKIIDEFTSNGILCSQIGEALPKYGPNAKVNILLNNEPIIDEPLNNLRNEWEHVSDLLQEYQTNRICVKQEIESRQKVELIQYQCNFDYSYDTSFINDANYFTTAPKLAVIREEGSNGDREMAAAFLLAGFSVFDITMSDIIQGHSLENFRGVAFVGGFSFADVLGSAKGWSAAIRYHAQVSQQFTSFYRRAGTFSFGVCNGCQLMARLGWIDGCFDAQNISLDENHCGRFESTFGPVKIEKSTSIMLQGMEQSVLGLWSSHGEGRFTYRNAQVLDDLEKNHQICVRYTNASGNNSKVEELPYPWNPNGSTHNVAAICSKDGRHLAMMPHSDRTFLQWQWPDNRPKQSEDRIPLSPWIQMFRNAYNWCKQN